MDEQRVEKYQCPGCVIGMDTNCGKAASDDAGVGCTAHVPGTSMLPNIRILLGMPTGFNKFVRGTVPPPHTTPIFIGPSSLAGYGDLNVPVWAMQHGDDVLVRCCMPRINITRIYIHPNERIEDVAPNAINPSTLDID